MNLDDRTFTTATLTAATGCEPMTFRTWRNRNGLFPEVAGGRKWKRFTVVDLCVVRTIVVATAHGLAISNAVNFAQNHLRSRFERLLTGEAETDLVGFFSGGVRSDGAVVYLNEDDQPQAAKMNGRPDPSFSFVFLDDHASLTATLASTRGIISILDLKALAQQVLDALARIDDTNQ